MSSTAAVELPENFREFGVIHVPHVSLDELGDRLDDDVAKHIASTGDEQPLCGVGTAPDAPLYPFRGLRTGVREHVKQCCPDCVRAFTGGRDD